MATRKPVSVLPDPVGEATSTSCPAAMWGQAAACGEVGPAGKRRANQPATAGWKSDSGEAAGEGSGTVLFHQAGATPTNAAAAGPGGSGGVGLRQGENSRVRRCGSARRTGTPARGGVG